MKAGNSKSDMKSENLLIIHQGALGDFVLTFPAIIQLHDLYDPIDVICQSELGKLAKTLKLVSNWFPLESAYFASLFSNRIDSRITDILKSYDKIVIFTLSPQLEKTITQITAKVICRIPSKPQVEARIHLGEFVLQNLIACGLLKKRSTVFEDISLPDCKSRSKKSRKILLHPGAGSTRKRWPIDNFLAVEKRLKSDGLKPEFVLGPAEQNLAKRLMQNTDHKRQLHLPNGLTDLVDLYKSAGGYIGNDSGASHLAAFLAVPTVVIFGPTDPQRWAPLGRRVAIVRPALTCNPCFESDNANCADPICLDDTLPETIINTISGF